MQFVTNLNFNGNCEEAFKFYANALQAKIDATNYYREMPTDPNQPMDPAYADKVMHSSISKDGKLVLMGADLLPGMSPEYIVGSNLEICVMPEDKAECDRVFAALSEGGTVVMPMEDQFWGDYFGACKDKYGFGWMVICPSNK